MDILRKLKETVASIGPVMLIVLVLGVTVAPLGSDLLVRFILGGVLVIAGLTVFLTGVDIGILPIGERCGAILTRRRNLTLLLAASFIIGFIVTVAEPDIQVFSGQVCSVYPRINRYFLIGMIAAGVGLFMMIGLLRIVLRLPLRVVLIIIYAVVFLFAAFESAGIVGVSFDSGGATTGPMTVPFIMALGIGVAAVRTDRLENSRDESFGLTGIASVGPILAVLLYGSFFSEHTNFSSVPQTTTVISSEVIGAGVFLHIVPGIMNEAALSLLPLVVLFVIFQLTLLKMPPRQVYRMSVGLFYSYIGLVIFLTGVRGGFMPAGWKLGALLGKQAAEFAGWWSFLLVATGVILGAVVVCAEPAVWVLTSQVEAVSGGTIKKRALLFFLSAGVASAIGLSMWRVLAGFSLMYILVPGYAFSLVLALFCPPLFTGIAFDSGGVASGPITSTLVLSFTLGASSAAGTRSDMFGVIALVSMAPLIAIQILGMEYCRKGKCS